MDMLSKASEYAIRALVYIETKNRGNNRPGYREIAAAIDAPEQFTAKLLQSLVRQGLLKSVRGRGWGFFFDADADPLKLVDVITSVEGNKLFTKCGIGLSQCSSESPCPIHHEYAVIRDRYLNLVSQTTIQILAARIMEGDAVLNRLNLLDS